jgi:type VI secretion system protein ImpH
VSAYGWRKNSPVDEWLYEEPQRFDFYQAVRLLEIAEAARASGGGAEAAREVVRFRSAVSLAFPESDVAAVKPRAVGGASAENGAGAAPTPQPGDWSLRAEQMSVNIMGLAGASGPLPMPLTEVVIDRTRKGDRAARDFLDIFNNRLVSLLYRIRKLHRVGLDIRPPGEDAFAGWLFSIIGLGTPNLEARLQVKDRALLFYAGLLGQRQRSMAGLETMLSDYFGVGVRGKESVGRWLPLEREQWTVLRRGTTPERRERRTAGGGWRDGQGLGEGAVLGKRVWDQQGAFELGLGPLTLAQFIDFLPTGWAFRPLCDLVRFYVGDDLDFSFRLTLKAGETTRTGPRAGRLGQSARLGVTRLAAGGAGMRLSNNDAVGARLGWTSWLAAPGREQEDSRVVVSTRPLRAFGVESTIPYFALPPDKLMEIRRLMEKQTYEAHAHVIRQGEAGDSLFVVQSGRVKVVRRYEGRDVQLGTLGPGDFFGEMALLTGKVRHATVITLEPCELYVLSRKSLEEMMARYPRFGSYLHHYAQMRQRKGNRL